MPELPRRTLGRTGLNVTILGYGAMEMRGGTRAPEITDKQADQVLNAVLDGGINFIDTSIDYGLSEERIGRFISHRRSEYYLASKCGCVPGVAQGSDHVHTPENVRAGVETSLRLMKTDYLDIVQFHRSLSQKELEETGSLDELRKLQQEGKVRFIGVSATLPNMLEHIDMGVFDEFQVPYSILQRDHEDVIAKASAAGAGIVVRGGVVRGKPSDWERTYYMVSDELIRRRWEDAHLDDLLDGMSRMEFTLRFTLSHPDLDTTIVGTKDVGHLRDNIAAAAKGSLPPDVITEAKRRLNEVGATAERIG